MHGVLEHYDLSDLVAACSSDNSIWLWFYFALGGLKHHLCQVKASFLSGVVHLGLLLQMAAEGISPGLHLEFHFPRGEDYKSGFA